MFEDPTSLGGLAKSLALAMIGAIRDNKLPAALSAVTFVVFTALALTSDFDERARYRQLLLPEIDKVEAQFFAIMREAEETPNQLWRLQFFVDGHRRAKAVLRLIRSQRPITAAGRQAQNELIRYYELVDEELAIIRTEMSLKESYDYL